MMPTASTSLKGADITIQTIKKLIEEGEKDTRDQVNFLEVPTTSQYS